jgi:hypothetical protein
MATIAVIDAQENKEKKNNRLKFCKSKRTFLSLKK